MHKHEHKYCPRCNVLFECKVGNITQCQCYNIHLKTEEQAYINGVYPDCLCANCIKEVRSEYNRSRFSARLKKLFGFR
jgi:hypothetical protein